MFEHRDHEKTFVSRARAPLKEWMIHQKKFFSSSFKKNPRTMTEKNRVPLLLTIVHDDDVKYLRIIDPSRGERLGRSLLDVRGVVFDNRSEICVIGIIGKVLIFKVTNAYLTDVYACDLETGEADIKIKKFPGVATWCNDAFVVTCSYGGCVRFYRSEIFVHVTGHVRNVAKTFAIDRYMICCVTDVALNNTSMIVCNKNETDMSIMTFELDKEELSRASLIDEVENGPSGTLSEITIPIRYVDRLLSRGYHISTMIERAMTDSVDVLVLKKKTFGRDIVRSLDVNDMRETSRTKVPLYMTSSSTRLATVDGDSYVIYDETTARLMSHDSAIKNFPFDEISAGSGFLVTKHGDHITVFDSTSMVETIYESCGMMSFTKICW